MVSDLLTNMFREIVKRHLAVLNEHKFPRPNDMHPRVPTKFSKELSEPLSIIFKISLRMEDVPQDWRRVNVILIFKKGTKDDPGDYKPVSLTSVSEKTLKPILKGSIFKHQKGNLVIQQDQQVQPD